MEECLCNHCCCERSVPIPYSEHVFVALGIQHAMCMCHFVICDLPDSTIFFSSLSHKGRNLKKKFIEYKVLFLFSLEIFVWNISHSKRNWARYDKTYVLVSMLRIRYSCPNLMSLEACRQIFEKYANIKFHEHPSSGSNVASCGPTGCQTDMANLIVTFRNFVNPPKSKPIFIKHKLPCFQFSINFLFPFLLE